MRPEIVAASKNNDGDPANPENLTPRIALQNGAYYADLADDIIRICNKESAQLLVFGANIFPFEERPLSVVLEAHLMGFNQGNQAGYAACRKKTTEILNICL